jgi:hypothetical protein
MTHSSLLGGRDPQYGQQAVARFLQSTAGSIDPYFHTEDLQPDKTSPTLTRGICYKEREGADWSYSPQC